MLSPYDKIARKLSGDSVFIAYEMNFHCFSPLSNSTDIFHLMCLLILGCIAVPGATGGQFIGGYVCKKFDLKITEMTKLALAGFVVSLLTWGVVWVGCEKNSMAGVSHNYQDYRFNSLLHFYFHFHFSLKSYPLFYFLFLITKY